MVEPQAPQATNVIPFRAEFSIFTRPLRQRLEEGLKPLTQDSRAAVDSFEQILSLYIVAGVKKVVERYAAAAGKALAKRAVGG